MISDYIRLLRIRHWVKEAFIFAPLVFSLNFYKPPYIARVVLISASFCLTSSLVYVINDIFDRERDRLHPKKKKRPLASGAASVRGALFLASFLFVLAVGLALPLGLKALAVILAYACLNVLYSLVLKNQMFIDVMVIAAGFQLRLVAGAVAIDVELSRWMMLTTFFLSLFLAFGKRRKEIITTGGNAEYRQVFRHYSVELLNYLIVVTASLTIITYSLYIVISKSMIALGAERFVLTIPFVVFGVFRYLYLIFRNDSAGDPAELLLKDRALIADILLWLLAVIVLLLVALASRGGP